MRCKSLIKLTGITLVLSMMFFAVGCSKEDKMFKAIGKGDIATVEKLLEGGIDVNCESLNGITPLMAAINDCRLEIFELLLDYGADVNAEDYNGNNVHAYAMKSKARNCPHKFERMILKHEDYGN